MIKSIEKRTLNRLRSVLGAALLIVGIGSLSLLNAGFSATSITKGETIKLESDCNSRVAEVERMVSKLTDDVKSLAEEQRDLNSKKPKLSERAIESNKKQYNKDMRSWQTQVQDLVAKIQQKSQALREMKDNALPAAKNEAENCKERKRENAKKAK